MTTSAAIPDAMAAYWNFASALDEETSLEEAFGNIDDEVRFMNWVTKVHTLFFVPYTISDYRTSASSLSASLVAQACHKATRLKAMHKISKEYGIAIRAIDTLAQDILQCWKRLSQLFSQNKKLNKRAIRQVFDTGLYQRSLRDYLCARAVAGREVQKVVDTLQLPSE